MGRNSLFMLVIALSWSCLPATNHAVNGQTPTGVSPGSEKNESKPNPMNQDSPQHTNELIHATSPYLLQHAHNPVDWREWKPETLALAKTQDKPIFLSIGYSACHWCHVMEHESFSHAEVAKLINEYFIPIKVDREERPDIDELYMAYTVAATGSGGWPMSVWLTPEGVPFHAGTYFPKVQFMGLLQNIHNVWANSREKILEQDENIKGFFKQWSATAPAQGVITQEQVDNAATLLSRHFDKKTGGISGGGTNKFPPSLSMELMLRVHARTGDKSLLDAVNVTLDNMARGGIYDHLGGGICRYSTDVDWLVPHFEKMLYDQGLVSGIYLDGYQATGKPLFAATARDILDYVIADLQSPEGGFYSSRDADSEGFEGKFYIWTLSEVQQILGEDDAKLFAAYYDVSEKGNWFERFGHAPAGPKNILRIRTPKEEFAREHGLSVSDVEKRLAGWREKMLAVRSKRVPPGLDDKVLTAWNGLMIASLAKGARVLDEPKYADHAARAADFILENMQKDGRLLRTWRKGDARLTGYLNDYAFFIEALLNLYEATFDMRWLNESKRLNDVLIEHYWDEQHGGFFFTSDDGENLIARSKSPSDGAIPSGNSIAASNLLRLAVLFDRKDYREKAEGILRAFAERAGQSPYSSERLLCAADLYHDKVKEIAIVGPASAPETKALLETVYDKYLPNKVVVAGDGEDTENHPLPLLKRKTTVNGLPAAYVCENYACKRPVTTPEVLARLLFGKGE